MAGMQAVAPTSRPVYGFSTSLIPAVVTMRAPLSRLWYGLLKGLPRQMGTTFLKLVSRPPEARKLQPHLNALTGALRTVRQIAYPSNSLLVVVSPVSSDHGGMVCSLQSSCTDAQPYRFAILRGSLDCRGSWDWVWVEEL